MKKKMIGIIGGIVGALVLAVGGYVSYVALQYSRIANEIPLDIYHKTQNTLVKVGEEYSISTYNIGFGAYSPDFDFLWMKVS